MWRALETFWPSRPWPRRFRHQQHPLYPGLRSLVLKTAGVPEGLRQALRVTGVRVAFLSGSEAASPERLARELPLVVIGVIAKRQLEQRLVWAEQRAGRELNCWPLTVEQFKTRKRPGDRVLTPEDIKNLSL